MRTVFVKPMPGKLVQDPVSFAKLPEDGAEVNPNDTYWARRIADKDVEIVEAMPAESDQTARGEEAKQNQKRK